MRFLSQVEANAVLQEVHILASLEHPFIIRYYDSFLETRKLFLVMEYAPNGSLHSALLHHQRLQRPLAEDTIWRYALQLLLGLHAIHTCHIVHRDIKPQNILLSANDSVKIGTSAVLPFPSSCLPILVIQRAVPAATIAVAHPPSAARTR